MTIPLVTTTRGAFLCEGKSPSGCPLYITSVRSSVISAKQFLRADTIVVAAPHWDLSFPATLKQYFEQINVVGLTFFYADSDVPTTLCRAKRLIYTATAGGPVRSHDFGFGYVKALGAEFYGIADAVLFCAEGLDIVGADAEAILEKVEAEIDRALR